MNSHLKMHRPPKSLREKRKIIESESNINTCELYKVKIVMWINELASNYLVAIGYNNLLNLEREIE